MIGYLINELKSTDANKPSFDEFDNHEGHNIINSDNQNLHEYLTKNTSNESVSVKEIILEHAKLNQRTNDSEITNDHEIASTKEKILELMKLDDFLSDDEDEDENNEENEQDEIEKDTKDNILRNINMSPFQSIPATIDNIHTININNINKSVNIKENDKKINNREMEDILINNLCYVDEFLQNLLDQKDVKNNHNAVDKLKSKKSHVSESDESYEVEERMDFDSPLLNDDNLETNNILSFVKDENLLNDFNNYTYDTDDNLSTDCIIGIKDEEDVKQKNNKKPIPGATTKIYPLLSPVRLNLIKSPISLKSSESTETCLKKENFEEIQAKSSNEQDISDDEDVFQKKRSIKVKMELESEEEDIELKNLNDTQTDRIDDLPLKSKNKKEKENKKNKRKRKAKKVESEDDIVENRSDLNEQDEENITHYYASDNDISIKPRKRKTRKIIEDSKLKPETLLALEQEADRVRRLENQKRLSLMQVEDGKYSDLFLDTAKLIKINRNIGCHLKDYQIKGIKFMYENCYESVDATRNNYQGGCILGNYLTKILIKYFLKLSSNF